MKDFTKAIKTAIGLNFSEFCEQYLGSTTQAFRARTISGGINPNEAILICLITNKTPKELFDQTVAELLFMRGNDHVNNLLKQMLQDPDASQRLNRLFENDVVPNIAERIKEFAPKPKERKPKERKSKTISKAPDARPAMAVAVEDDFEIDFNIFRK